MVLLNSVGMLPAPLQAGLNDVSRGCLVAAIAALGTKTSFAQLARAGWRPLALIADAQSRVLPGTTTTRLCRLTQPEQLQFGLVPQ